MSVAVIGRTRWLLDAARQLAEAGVPIGLVATAQAESFYDCEVEAFEGFAKAAGAPYALAPKLNGEDGVSLLRDAGCEIAISVNWPSVIGADAIAAFPLGILNAHAGDLPRYRGNACPNWAILNGEDHIGLCVHLMEPGQLDSGPVVRRDLFAVDDDTYITDVYQWLDGRIPVLLAEAVRAMLDGAAKPEPQPTNASLALRCYPRRREDGRIDWRQPAALVHRLVRASSRPFTGAFCHDEDGRRVTVWRAEPFAHPGPFLAVPGQVMLRDDGAPVVACGEGCLKLTEVGTEGVADDAETRRLLIRSLRTRLC